MSPLEVQVENLVKRFGRQTVLDIPRMVFPGGGITALLGHNGTGKTTLLNIIAGLDADYTGRVFYDGQLLRRDIMRDITLVFQSPLMINTSVQKNAEWPLKIRRIPDSGRLAVDMLERIGLADMKNRRANTLSGGEQQKLALARALVFCPRLLLLDEPTSSVDKRAAGAIEQMLLAYHARTKGAIIIVTHDKSQADRLASNQIVIGD